ncbi:hypothetical protein HCN44_006733 [Aphidius gifuensis]|uniref:Biogenesis of lysosome-related organelles complex 1 subunit 6 n=1 Tax=Aphidius gifuensis TaxID=684658 RepID=A0A834Y333_APHGI|nr:biogenesis of lysosome-related organelles complex 1 subunit 6 [Aphidius gifuensis]KAF7995626.1 hypothetical protein HCN44_006733 [Aphidius gifuensis]
MMSDIGEAAAAEVHLSSQEFNEELINIKQIAKHLPIVLGSCSSELGQLKSDLLELQKKQNGLIDKMQVENQQLTETAQDGMCSRMYPLIKSYNDKLHRIKKEILSVHERTVKLKKRALRLQQIKEKEALYKEQKREEDLRREQELIGKPLPNK